MGTCPKCESAVMVANIGDVTVQAAGGKQWRGIKYYCPACGAILSVSIDPIAIKTDIVEEILRALGKR